MKLHANARTCPNSRQLLVDRVREGWSVMEAAEAAGITDRTARRWLARWREEGPLACWIVPRRRSGSRTRHRPIGPRRSVSCASCG